MEETWHDRFLGFMAEYLRDTRSDLKVDKVLAIWQDTDIYGGCETCGYGASGPSIEVTYVTVDGERDSIVIDGDFASIFGY